MIGILKSPAEGCGGFVVLRDVTDQLSGEVGSRSEDTSTSRLIRKERATRKNSQPAAARRVALKMGRRLRCSSVTYRFRYAPSRRPILNATTSPLYSRRYTGLQFSHAKWIQAIIAG